MDRTPQRREKLVESLRADGVAALLVASVTNVSYLTGFSGDDSTLIVGPGGAVVISDGRYETQLAQECPGLEVHIRPVGQPMVDGVAAIASKLGVRNLGFESTACTFAEYEDLRGKLSGVELAPVKGRVEELRAIKDEDEIAAIREAIGYAERAFARLRAGIKIGQSEKDVADDLEDYLRRAGATGASFPPIVAVGRRAALPHARPTPETKVGDDDFLLVDWGATGRPYKSDLTRMVVTGKVTDEFERHYRLVLEAQERGIAAIRPGVAARDVDAEARSVIERAGLDRYFDHGLGHGIGMDIHEAPRLRRESDVTLRPGMVVTVEPGIYLPDWGGIRIEDDVLVTPDGHEVLTSVPKALDSVRV